MFDGRINALLDSRDKTQPPKKDEPKPLGTNRTGHKRTSLATLVADIVFGPPKED